MLRYTLERTIYMIITLWVIVTLTFFLMHMIPGDPFTSEKRVPEQIRQNMLAKYHLDKPLIVQYGYYLKNLLHGDLGISLKYLNRTVNEIIANGFPASFQIGMQSIILGVFLGLILGIVAALNRNGFWDYVSMILAIIGRSVPNFIIATLLQYWIASKLRWLPVSGWGTFAHTILPSIALSFASLSIISRLMRASMLDVIGQDYIKTAKSKGLSSFEIIWRHMIRNAILPVITVLGPLIAGIVTGTFVVERIFGIPGLGKYFVQSIYNNDYTMILGTTIFYSAILVFLVFLVDITYGLIDPRIRLAKGGK
ncbi:oligopeptide transport system permease protein [Thermoanaerobacter thermohydrosulfuricus]|uniref:ABC-type dipeptide/oligopeptide/nickel transport system, permease component n=3 Tax=Thermoanaerobacter TaxID=1754 RepID=I8R573_9THEO|nr:MULTISPECIES: ABC transporter permease [Thermoanaerobacter]HHY79486.1 ABC transporter permease [Thermoanaerobacter sp.]EIW00595.1 ABC-type dipeptide/oligopeptide/nickel transport system, permease component [Thermoanaerobacter siderophilus SR4]EMT37967.1 ABC-type dipeptide/oligopeptide/nickel transport systems, permease components [Thermoanaerobacter thermohydrosulfuricus WC1]UZQ83603.1 ABC transporter permease [Thermoanaerobacter sp. RKWS2]SDG01770.1 oligopeptide transport system permease p